MNFQLAPVSMISPPPRFVAVILILLVTGMARAQPGSLEPGFTSTGWSSPRLLAVRSDGKFLATGDSTGKSLNRFNNNGTPDLEFACSFDQYVAGAVIQPDGKIAVAGTFQTVDGIKQSYVARLKADGSYDSSFVPKLDYSASCIAMDGDGKMVIGGVFTTVNDITHNRIARLNADGSLDGSFTASLNQTCNSVRVQRDGKMIAVGSFTSVNGVNRPGLVRLNSNGSLDSSFSPAITGTTSWAVPLPNGQVLVAYRTTNVPAGKLVRLNSNGTVDFTFNGDAANAYYIYDLAVQSDGRILVSGQFPKATSPFSSYGIIRLEQNGTLDPTFIVQPSSGLTSIAFSPDGRLLVGSDTLFYRIEGVTIFSIARLRTDPSTSVLERAASDRVIWTRGGAAPAVGGSFLEIFNAESKTWNRLAEGQPTDGGWEFSNLSLPASGVLRARGSVLEARVDSTMEQYLNVGAVRPVLAMDQRKVKSLQPEETVDFHQVFAGGNREIDFTVRNVGDGVMAGISTEISGVSASDFAVQILPAEALTPGSETTLRIRFTPAAEGVRTAVLLVSSDASVEPFRIYLSGHSGTVFNPVFDFAGQKLINSQDFNPAGKSFGSLTLGFAPVPGTLLTLVNHVGTSGSVINGFLDGLPDGARVSAYFGGNTYLFEAGYRGGDGNNLTLSLVGDGSLQLQMADSPDTGTLFSVASDGDLLLGNVGAGKQLMKMKRDGRSVSTFRPSISGTVNLMTSLENGSILVFGDLIENGATTSNRLVKLKFDGSVDPSFVSGINGVISAIKPTSDGKIYVGGNIAAGTRKYIIRLNGDGSVDPLFNPTFSQTDAIIVSGMAIQIDGSLLVAGSGFPPLGPVIGGTSLVRFSTTGIRDAAFQAGIATALAQVAVQADGKILVLGTSPYFRRLNSNGSPDATFNYTGDGFITAFTPLADGKMMMRGSFTQIGDVSRKSVVRLNPNGNVDESYRSDLNSVPGALVLGESGDLYVGGTNLVVNGVKSKGIARLVNATAGSGGERVDASTFRWHRSGAVPEMEWMAEDFFPSGGAAWTGGWQGRRIEGGWEMVSPVPLTDGTVRLRGASVSGGSMVVAEAFSDTGAISSDLAVKEGAVAVANGSNLDMGAMLPGYRLERPLTLLNRGNGLLHGFSAVVSGANAGEFQLDQNLPPTLTPGQTAALLIQFKPSEVGVRTATLQIFSNDPTEQPYIIQLTGVGLNRLSPVFNSPAGAKIENDGFSPGSREFGELTLGFVPPPNTVLTVVNNTGTTATNGVFSDLPEQSYVSASFNGQSYTFLVSYKGGTGNDLVLRLYGTGSVLRGFTRPVFSAGVIGLAVQKDGRMLLGGDFFAIDGKPYTKLARLLPNGEMDTGFNASANSRSECFLIQDDGKILVGGSFTTINGISKSGLARLNPDGSSDDSFQVSFTSVSSSPYNGTASPSRLLKLRSGKILVGGYFKKVNGIERNNLALLNPDGSLDLGFNASFVDALPASEGQIFALYEQPDGAILVGGTFSYVNGVPRRGLVRLKPDGTLDPGFSDPLLDPSATYFRVSGIIPLPDGKIVIGGDFRTAGGSAHLGLARLNANGSVDAGFTPSFSNVIYGMALQADGKILVGGAFKDATAFGHGRFVRLNPDGSVDASFDPQPDGTIQACGMLPDGKIIIGGDFTNVGGADAKGFAILENDPALASLELAGTGLLFKSGGTAPELRKVVFEISPDDGSHWSTVGEGVRNAEGWRLDGIVIPPSGHVRVSAEGVTSNRSWVSIERSLLFGRGLSSIERWRQANFGAALNERAGADLNDFDADGIPNLIEYAFGLDPLRGGQGELPRWQNESGELILGFSKPPAVEGITYRAEWSESLAPDDWWEIPDSGSGDGHLFGVAAGGRTKMFFRMKVER